MLRLLNGAIQALWTVPSDRDGNDWITGGEDADTLLGGGGDDYLGGEGGHDVLLGDNAQLVYFEGEILDLDRDALPIKHLHDHDHHKKHDHHDHHDKHDKHHHHGHHGHLDIHGIELTDIGSGGDDRLEGGIDDDLMFGQGGNDTYIFSGGGLGEDTIIEAGDNDETGAVNDLHDTLDFSGFIGSVKLDLGQDHQQDINKGRFNGDVNLRLTIGFGAAIEDVIGSEYDDDIKGNDRDNDIRGRGGNDKIEGRKGNDTLYGNDGDDDLKGGDGDDALHGGRGHDKLKGDKGKDRLFGGDGDDELDGDSDDVVLDGGAGDNKIKVGKPPKSKGGKK
jgi:Ca2+-binding RTX toxin-like protein